MELLQSRLLRLELGPLADERAVAFMYGRSAVQDRGQVAPVPKPSFMARTAQNSRTAQKKANVTWFPWLVVGAIAVWVLWAVLERHEKVREVINPRNIGLNVRNAAVILFTVIVGVPLIKIGVAKYNALTGGRAGGRLLAQLVGAV